MGIWVISWSIPTTTSTQHPVKSHGNLILPSHHLHQRGGSHVGVCGWTCSQCSQVVTLGGAVLVLPGWDVDWPGWCPQATLSPIKTTNAWRVDKQRFGFRVKACGGWEQGSGYEQGQMFPDRKAIMIPVGCYALVSHTGASSAVRSIRAIWVCLLGIAKWGADEYTAGRCG
jgi:hypothetical protein